MLYLHFLYLLAVYLHLWISATHRAQKHIGFMVVLQVATLIAIYIECLAHMAIVFNLQRYDKNLIRRK